jgi:hypothetical protein
MIKTFMKNYKFSIGFVTLYLIVFAIAGQLGVSLNVMLWLFSVSPVLLFWMVYTILKYGKHSGKVLAENEEWAYEDIEKDKLSTF